MTYVVFDLDGTLANINHRLHHIDLVEYVPCNQTLKHHHAPDG